MQADYTAFLRGESVVKTDYVRAFCSVHIKEGSCTYSRVGHFSPNCSDIEVLAERVVDSISP